MNPSALVYPMLVMVILTLTVLVALFRARTKSVEDGQVNADYFRTYQGGSEPEQSLQLSRHFANLFETPVLFYAGCVAAMALNKVDLVLVALAWTYVIARVIHAYVHTGSNKLQLRIPAYFTSVAIIAIMWLYLAIASAF
ncbi:MAG: MAPEG family protein [Pseudomonadota bacterium]